MRGFRMGDARHRFLIGVHLRQRTELLCTGTSNTNSKTSKAAEAAKSLRDFDAYRQVEKLDFMTAAKILFTTPPKKKKFGLDFHLVQLFFACMPSLAVYLVAQYARYEIRRMEAEVELKKKQAEEEEKAKEIEVSASEETEDVKSDPELLKVKVRLDALEEAVKEMVVVSKNLPSGNLTKNQDDTKGEKLKSRSDGSSAADVLKPEVETVSGSGPAIDASRRERAANGGDLQESKK